MYYNGGDVGIGTSNPITKLHVKVTNDLALFAETSGSSGLVAIAGEAHGTSGTNYGVRGYTASSSGYGVYSVGRFAATGTKSFQIDHPLDPANVYLNHFSAEGPEPYLIYRGNVVLDVAGEAWVELPEYFEAVNRDFQYQLTPVGAPGPDLYVAQEVENNRFLIAGGPPGTKVSWCVTGMRDDPWMRDNPMPDVQPKPAEHRGKYLHPELYGVPKELGIHFVSIPAGTKVEYEVPISH